MIKITLKTLSIAVSVKIHYGIQTLYKQTNPQERRALKFISVLWGHSLNVT